MRSSRNRLRVTAQLIRASVGFHLWSQTYDREPEDVIRIRDDIAVEIAKALETAMDPEFSFAYWELAQPPNDQDAQNRQLELLADLGMIDERRAAIEEYERRDGYDIRVTMWSVTFSMPTEDREFVRRYALDPLRRIPDRPFIQYQSHRSLLRAGDIDIASALLPAMQASDLPEQTRTLTLLRQACAEGDLKEAERIYDVMMAKHLDDLSMNWISNRIFGRFDPTPFPNLVQYLKSQGVEPRKPVEMTYRCRAQSTFINQSSGQLPNIHHAYW